MSDIFTDLKYDVRQKADAAVVADTMTEGMAENQHIAALAGVRIDDRYKVSPETRKVIRISI